MTRSVEIPEAAREAAKFALLEHMREWLEDGTVRCKCGYVDDQPFGWPLHQADRAVAAALPYLAPAAETEGCTSCGYPSLYQGGCTNCGASAAPAGDGGLREALEKLVENADHYDTCSSLLNPDAGYECSCLLADIRALLAAHPAGPAVPQPADVEYEDEERETEADVERRNHWFRLAVELGRQDEFVEMLAHERRLPASRADLAAVPQPVDREALADDVDSLLWQHRSVASNGTQSVCACDRTWRSDTEHRTHLRNAVLAVLAGEQEQVEK